MSPIDNIIEQLEQRRAAIENALEALRGMSAETVPLKRGPGRPKGGGMSSEGRQRQIEAMRRYWAQKKGGQKKATKKRGLTPAGRKALSENMKRMWAEKRLGR